MSKIIKLTQGREAIVDDDDYEKLSKHKWHFNIKSKTFGYAQRSKRCKIEYKKYRSKTIYMHREVLVTDLEVDHINGNTLDNRKENLRVATRVQNLQNRRSCTGSTSRYVGVHLHKQTMRWRAQIKLDNKIISLGMFPTEEEAYAARLKFISDNNLDRFRR